MALFLSRFIEIANSKVDEFFIVDSAHILPEDIINYLDLDKWDVYYLGYPNITPLEKLNEVRKYANGGWIHRRNNAELMEILGQLIEISKNIESICDKHSIKFIDTSNKDINKIVNEIVEHY